MERKVLLFEQMLELIQNLVDRIETIEKTDLEKTATSTIRRRFDERGGCV